MRRPFATIIPAITAALLIASPAFAEDAKKEQLTADPNVKESQSPQITPLGKNEPQNHETDAKPNLQALIDQAHNGSTGITTPKGTRQRPDQPAELRDGTAPRVIEKPF